MAPPRKQPLDPINGTNWRTWYTLNRWRKRAKAQLRAYPFCKMCLDRGVVTPAAIADHIAPHAGDWHAFWLGDLQSLCKSCHDQGKRIASLRGYDPRHIDEEGWPLDPRHPANAKQ